MTVGAPGVVATTTGAGVAATTGAAGVVATVGDWVAQPPNTPTTATKAPNVFMMSSLERLWAVQRIQCGCQRPCVTRRTSRSSRHFARLTLLSRLGFCYDT